MSLNTKFKCPNCQQEIEMPEGCTPETATCPHCSKPLNNSADAQQPTPLPLAKTSMVLGIVSFIGIPFCGLAALISGSIALSKIKQSKGVLIGTGKATAGIVLGCWSILRIIILLAIVVPFLIKFAQERKQEILCKNHLMQISIATRMYASDHDDKIPSSINDIKEYIGSEPFGCPVIDSNSKLSIASYNEYVFLPLVVNGKKIQRLSQIESSSEIPMIICKHHRQYDFILYANGRVEKKLKPTEPQP